MHTYVQPSYCSGEFVSDLRHLDGCCNTPLVCLQEDDTSRKERNNFTFSSKTEFPLVHPSGPCSGVIYVGEEKPSHLLDTRTMESNTEQATSSNTPADSPASSDPRNLPSTLNCSADLSSDRGSLTSDKDLSDETPVTEAPGEKETLSRGQRANE